MTDAPTLKEKLAKAIYKSETGHRNLIWENGDDWQRKPYYRLADAALSVFREHLEAKETPFSGDLFWNAEDPERPYYDPEEIARDAWDYGGANFGIIDVQRANTLPNQSYYFSVKHEEGDLEKIDLTPITDAQAKAGNAAWAVGYFARKIFTRIERDRAAALSSVVEG